MNENNTTVTSAVAGSARATSLGEGEAVVLVRANRLEVRLTRRLQRDITFIETDRTVKTLPPVGHGRDGSV
jgi:hypothetical protein